MSTVYQVLKCFELLYRRDPIVPWLDSNIKDSEIFPSGYKLHRKDSTTNGGGVLIAVKEEFNSEDVPELDTSCEIIWAWIKLIGNGNVYVCSYYRRDVSVEESIEELDKSLTRVSAIRNATTLIGGDFNFPGWDWKNKRLKPKTAYPSLHTKFSEILDDVSMVQIVEEPTRKNNTLDLLITNQPDKILRVDVLPGVSDHDIVFAEFDLRPIKYSQKPRQITLYKRATGTSSDPIWHHWRTLSPSCMILTQWMWMICGQRSEIACRLVQPPTYLTNSPSLKINIHG